MHERTNTTRRDTDRAQTTLDFAIAMGVFLLAVAFVFTFIPTLTAPFLDGDQELSAASDRTASHLSEGALGHPDEPFVVTEECATAFFDSEDAPPACGFSGDDTRTHLGLSERIDVEVELVRVDGASEDRLCLTEDGDVGIDDGSTNCDVEYHVTTNEDQSGIDSTTVSRRVVSIAADDCGFADTEAGESCDATLRVTVW